MQTITNIVYMIIGIGLMILTISVGLIGFIKVWRDINKLKDTEE
jgi:NADH:ubiquinone oxidoreductase subunit K